MNDAVTDNDASGALLRRYDQSNGKIRGWSFTSIRIVLLLSLLLTPATVWIATQDDDYRLMPIAGGLLLVGAFCLLTFSLRRAKVALYSYGLAGLLGAVYAGATYNRSANYIGNSLGDGWLALLRLDEVQLICIGACCFLLGAAAIAILSKGKLPLLTQALTRRELESRIQ